MRGCFAGGINAHCAAMKRLDGEKLGLMNISASSNERSRAQRSTGFVVSRLNFRVRDGFGCGPAPVTADNVYM